MNSCGTSGLRLPMRHRLRTTTSSVTIARNVALSSAPFAATHLASFLILGREELRSASVFLRRCEAILPSCVPARRRSQARFPRVTVCLILAIRRLQDAAQRWIFPATAARDCRLSQLHRARCQRIRTRLSREGPRVVAHRHLTRLDEKAESA